MRIRIYNTFLMLLAVIGTMNLQAQVSAYPFTQLTTTYTPITGGQLLGTASNDDQVFVDPSVPAGTFSGATGVGLPIGFNFTFNGRVYDRFAVNSNGWIVLGQSSLSPAVNTNTSSGYTPISATSTAPAALQNRISAFGRDLLGYTGSSLRYQTIGTAPNRILVVQWSSYGRWPTTAGDNLNFQIRLFELGGVVQVVYGTCATTSTTNMAPQVGLRGDINTDFNNRTTTNNWSATTAGAINTASCTFTNTVTAPSGLTFQWGLLVNDDAGISALITPTAPLTPGLQPVDVVLNNYGSNVINNATVEWSAGGVLQPSVPYTGPLAPGANTTVSLGNYNFPAAPTTYRFWSSQPNSVLDGRTINDTFEVTLCGALPAGTYTVGTAASDFPTIQNMIDALYSCGISGPVVMNIQAGTYNGTVRFVGQITGASAVNTVTINGAGQGVTVLTHDGTGTNGNATLAFDGVSHVTVQNLSIRNSRTTLAWGALFINNARFNQLLNNRIEMYYAPNVISVYGVAFQASYTAAGTEANNANYNLIQGNNISGGDMGIRIEGGTATRTVGNHIINNYISNVDDYGIYTDDQDSMDIVGNRIENLLSTFNYGIYTTDPRSFNISSNTINARNYGIYGLNMGTGGTVTARNLISNNMVRFEVTNGFYFSGIRATDIYHNTVYGAGTSLTNATTHLLTITDVNVKNNIFINESGYVFRTSTAVALASMNHNLFYQAVPNVNGNFISFGTTTFNNFTNWQNNAFGHGANDVYGDPVFFSSTDLHVDGALANDAGDNSVGITIDIDGDVRPYPGSTTVDIGADEYKPKDNDAGVIALLSPVAPLATGFQPVSVTIKNFAIQPLNIFTVQWTYNGVQQSNFTYTGSPIPAQGTVDVTLGSVNFFQGLNADFEFWTIQPNNQADERTSNDTLRISLCPGLSGTYTVGGATSNFPTINEAIGALYQCGVAGPVVFNIEPGTYNGQILALRGNVPGASAANTITFDGNNPSLVTLTHDGSGTLQAATVLLDNVQFVTIQNMTINTTATGTVRGHGIHLINQADNNSIIGNVINSTWAAAINDKIGIVVSNSLTDDFAEGNTANNLLIQGNTIIGGEMGMHIEGSATVGVIRNIQIIDNIIEGYDDYGVYTDEIDSLIIIGNTIRSLNGSTIASGLYLFDPVFYHIERNFIHSRDWGLYLNSANNPFLGQRSKIINNMVTSTTDDGLYMTTTGNTDIWNNTFASSSPSATSANGAYILSPITGTLDIRNNIFFTSSTSTASYAFECTVNAAQLRMENNCYFSGGINTIRYGTANFTFANWVANNVYTYDQNSLNVNPLFVNLATGDLHIQNAALNAAGDSTVAVFNDFDLEVRPSLGTTRPDIGADEILLVNNDAIAIGVASPLVAACENTTQSVDVVVGNNGIANLTSVNVIVNVSGPVNTTLNGSYTGTLTTGQNTTVNVGTINTTGGGQFCFEVIVQMTGDANTTNDTIVICRNIVPAVPVLVAGNACLNQSTYVTSVPAGGISWYDVPSGGVALSTDDTLFTAPLVFATTYYAEVTACGATRYPVNVNVVIPTPINIGNDTTICTTGSAEIFAPSNVTDFVWSNGETTQSIVVNTAGNYAVTVSDVNGCRVSDNKDIFTFSEPTLSAVTNTLLCGNDGNGTVDLTVSGGNAPFIFSWNNGVNTEDISGLNTGTYTVVVTDANGCDYAESFIVNGPTAMSFNAINTSSASCGVFVDGLIDISVSGGQLPYSYLWNTGATTEDLTGVANGSYSVTVTDASGCQTNVSTTLNIVSSVAISVDNVQDEEVQLGGSISVSISGGQAPYYFLWNTGQTTATINNLVAANYTVTVTDVNGCSSVQTVTVNYAIPSLVEGIDAVQSLNVFPNPTYDIVNFQLQLNTETEVKLDIYAINGQLLQSFTSQNAVEQNYAVDMSAYPAGVYMARLIIGAEVVTSKIVLKK
jgi:trimeric autotransporter adhesin